MDLPAEAVIDTNVLLDWLVFADPSVARLVEAIESSQLRWIATRDMLAELRDVVARPAFTSRPPQPDRIEPAIERWCRVVETAPVHPVLVCSDADDQKFIDLALARSVAWLFSRDKALLALGRRARMRGVQICRPAAWTLET